MNPIYPNTTMLSTLSYIEHFFMQQKFQLEPKQRFNMCGLVGEPGYAYEILTCMYCFI